MTDQSKPTTGPDTRPREGGASDNKPRSPSTFPPSDPDRPSIGDDDEDDRGLRQDTQASGASERTSEDRSKSKDQQGKTQQQGNKPQQQSNTSRTDQDSRKSGGERSGQGKEGQPRHTDPEGDRRAK